MKLNELLIDFEIAKTNEESALLERMQGIAPFDNFTEREQVILQSLIRKSLISKIQRNGSTWVVKNERHC